MGGRKDIFGARRGTSFEAKKWLSLDVCGSIGVTLSFSVHIFAASVILCHLIAGSMMSTTFFVLLYLPVFSLSLASLYMAWTTDPGCVPMGARPLVTLNRASSETLGGGTSSTAGANKNRNRSLRRCLKCNDNFKPARAHHDSVTGRCIVKFDHFCPWVGNAVGAMNHKFFVLFVGYTMVSCLFSLCLIGLRMSYCGPPSPLLPGQRVQSEETDHKVECAGWNESYLGLALLIVSVVFFFFTSCMFFEQIETIKTNTSKIARMKMSVGQAGTELTRVTEEFNEMFGGDSNQVALHWFIPTPVEFPSGMKKIVLGYEWDETFDLVPYQPSNRDIEAGTSNSAPRSRIELAAVPPSASSSGSQVSGEGGQLSCSGLASSKHPKLVKRNSRDFDTDDPLRPLGGTFT
mmetsp:Transcript_10194/g.21377  ORF Transcript_10194/g.21377 Transcript_10194/m.21377 type:complete len:404 (+) Transcript_10194:158-1369(+)